MQARWFLISFRTVQQDSTAIPLPSKDIRNLMEDKDKKYAAYTYKYVLVPLLYSFTFSTHSECRVSFVGPENRQEILTNVSRRFADIVQRSVHLAIFPRNFAFSLHDEPESASTRKGGEAMTWHMKYIFVQEDGI